MCTIIPIETAKACSGKCKGGGCSRREPRIWVVAACDGMISLFEKQQHTLVPMPLGGTSVFCNNEQFTHSIAQAAQQHAYDQLIFVGTNSDIAWLHATIPAEAMHQVAAQIPYPLIPAWFKQQPELSSLTGALSSLLNA